MLVFKCVELVAQDVGLCLKRGLGADVGKYLYLSSFRNSLEFESKFSKNQFLVSYLSVTKLSMEKF